MTLSPERISELKEMAGKATPGPWRRASGTANYRVYGRFREVASAYQVKHGTRAGDVLVEADGRANASYIAAIDPATLTSILEEIEQYRAALAVYGMWAIDVSTLGELADLEVRMKKAGIGLQQIGEWSSNSGATP